MAWRRMRRPTSGTFKNNNMKKAINILLDIIAFIAFIGLLFVADNLLIQIPWTFGCLWYLAFWSKRRPEFDKENL